MYICYVDEAGDTGQFYFDRKDSQPAFVLSGLILPYVTLRQYTEAFIALKMKYFPDKCNGTRHNAVLAELKGSDLRQVFTKKNEQNKRHTLGFLNGLVALIGEHRGKIIGRIHIKKPDTPSKPAAIYTSSMQNICSSFQKFLQARENLGAVICDSRDYNQNNQTSHAIFTQMYKYGGDAYPNIVDMPTFGDSRNHAGIQTADLISSALLFPMAMHAYCIGHGLRNTHVQPKYRVLRETFWSKLAQLQYRYDIAHLDKSTKRSGGINVSDKLGRKHGSYLFKNPNNDSQPPQP